MQADTRTLGRRHPRLHAHRTEHDGAAHGQLVRRRTGCRGAARDLQHPRVLRQATMAATGSDVGGRHLASKTRTFML